MSDPDPRDAAPAEVGRPEGVDTRRKPARRAPASGPDAKASEGVITPAGIQSFADLLRAAYVGRKRRLNPKKSEIDAMHGRALLDPVEREQFLVHAAADRTLERTLELVLLSVDRFSKAPVLRAEIREFVRDVLRAHPAFQPESLAEALESRPDGGSDGDLVHTLASQAYDALRWPAGSLPMKKREADLCRTNALYCLLLWLHETQGTPLERIVHHLQASLWARSASLLKREPEKLRSLLAPRDVTALGVACSVFEIKIRDRIREADAARRCEAELRATLAKVEADLGPERTERQRLAEELRGERAERADERAHSRDQIEQLRGRVLGRLRAEVSLLDEGLNALRHNPPRVHVMLDHAERAIEGLRREIDRLQGSD